MNEPVPFDSPAVERGCGFFETLLLCERRAILWEPHVARILSTLSRLELPSPSPGELERAARAAVDRAGPGDQRALRLSWISTGLDLDSASSWRLDASVRVIPPSRLARRAGSMVVSLPVTLRRDSPGVKSTSYISALLGLRWAQSNGGDEGLLRTPGGLYLEGTGTAVVAWNDGALAGMGEDSLPSVTATLFLEGRGERRAVSGDEIRQGALLLGSLTTAVPILSLDAVPCRQPAAMRDAITEFNRRLLGDPALSKEV